MKVLVQDRFGDQIGVADTFGNFYPNGEKCKNPIKNRVFAPKWVKEAWEKGLLVVVEAFELRQDPGGRYYPVIRGKASENVVVKTDVSRNSHQFIKSEILLNGESRIVDKFPISKWREAPEWMKSDPDFCKVVRHYRIERLGRERYSNLRTREVISHMGIEKSLEIKDRDTAIIHLSYQQDVEKSWWVSKSLFAPEGTKEFIKKNSIEAEAFHKEQYEIPTSEVFHIEVLKEEPHVEIKRDRWDYESNDGRSSRYEEFHTYHEYVKTSIKFTPKEGWEWVGVRKCSFYTPVFQCGVSKWY